MQNSLISLDKFSTEELNLMCIFDTADRVTLRNDLVTALHDVYDPDMIAIFASTLEKLDTLTNEEFSEIGFYIADDDLQIEGDVFGE